MKVPKTLKPVKLPKKPVPDVSVNALDRFRLWLNDSLESTVKNLISYIVPTWVWLVFLAGLFGSVALYVWLK